MINTPITDGNHAVLFKIKVVVENQLLPNFANAACFLINISQYTDEKEVLWPSGSIFKI